MKTYHKFLKNVGHTISFLVLLSSCTKWRNNDIDSSSLSNAMSECLPDSVTTSSACLAKKNNYIYSAEYGGRGLVQGNQTGPDGQLIFTLPNGWYSSKTATVFDSDLQSSNLVSSFNLFGTSGSLLANAFPACQINTGLPNAASCTLPAGNYIYESSYGGRSLLCGSAPGIVNEPCWLSGNGLYLNGAIMPFCIKEGLQTDKCRVQASKYWYSSSYGGRSAVCNIPGQNATACWTNTNGVYVYDAACSDGYNGSACATLPNRYVYTQEYGGRNVICSNNSAGSCFFNSAKNIIEPNLIATNIKSGNTVFGIVGNYLGSDTEWGSGMARDRTAAKLTIKDETTNYAGINSTLPIGYRAISSITKDTDGGTLNPMPQVLRVNRTGWGSTTCGLSGTINSRISNCQTVFGVNANWNGNLSGNAGQGNWQLVSRSGDSNSGRGQEVWKDMTTGLMWSSLVSSGINWCKGIGNSNSMNTNVVSQALNEDDPSDICDQIFYQNQLIGSDVVSACAEYVGLTNSDLSIVNSGKSNLNKSSSPSVFWRAPSMYDYMIANQNGIRFVMPDMQETNQGDEWTATVFSADRAQAWTFNGGTGQRKVQHRSYLNGIRCIGR